MRRARVCSFSRVTRAALLAVLLTTVLATGTTGAASALRSTFTATASSTTDLVDNQIVQLTGSGFDPHAPIWASVCPSAPSPLLCNDMTLGVVHVDASGSLSGSVALRAVILDIWELTQIDCRTSACELRVGPALDDPLGSVRIPLTFLPTAPLNPPRITATPATGLTDGQTLRLSGEHYPPLTLVEGLQCHAGVGSIDGCDLRKGDISPKVTTSATGTFETEVTVHEVPEINNQPWDCGPGGRPCVLAGVWYFDFGGTEATWADRNFNYAYAVTPISFATVPCCTMRPSSTTTSSLPQGTGGPSPPAASVSAAPTFTG